MSFLVPLIQYVIVLFNVAGRCVQETKDGWLGPEFHNPPTESMWYDPNGKTKRTLAG